MRRKKGRRDPGWLSKRKKLGNMIKHCSDILSKAGHGDGGRGTTSLEGSDEEDSTTEEEMECGKVSDFCVKKRSDNK